MQRILAVDVGDKRTGFAVSDALGMMANGIGTVVEPNKEKLIMIIWDYAKQYEVKTVVIGYPINMNGSIGPRAEKIDWLAGRFKEISGIDVTLVDERCTTMIAHSILNTTNTRGKKRKNVVDTLSAEIILQSYLDANRGKLQ